MAPSLKGCTRVGEGPQVRGKVWVHGKGDIYVGDRVVFDAADAPVELHAARGATITIGDGCTLAGGASIDATSSITLGARCRVGAFCKVMDNHFHPLRGDRQVRPAATPVVVEDDVELGAHAILLPGARVERGARVAAYAIVRRRVGPGAVVAGRPPASGARPRRAPVPATDVSVVITASGRPELMVPSIRSALAQEGAVVEVIVVDDSPEAAARRIVADLGDERVTYVHRATPSQGRLAMVRDECWRRARGRYVHFLEDGDLVVPGAYAAQVAALDAHPLRAMSFGIVSPFGQDGAALERERAFWRLAADRARFASRLGRLGIVAMLFETTLFKSSACMLRRSALEEMAGGSDPAFEATGETALHVRAIRERGCVFLDRTVVDGRVRPNARACGPQTAWSVTEAHRRDHREHGDARGRVEVVLRLLGRAEAAMAGGTDVVKAAREGLGVARLAATDPSEAFRRLRRYAGVVRAAVLFRDCRRGAFVNAQGHVRVVAEGEVRLGDHVEFVKGAIPTALVAHRGAELAIGAGTIVAHSAHFEASRSVRIGQRCMIAPMVRVCDTDADGAAPIVIGDDVWLAHGVTIEPGVTVGAGSVVSAGSVVRRDVPPRSLAGGSPAVCAPLDAIEAHRATPRRA